MKLSRLIFKSPDARLLRLLFFFTIIAKAVVLLYVSEYGLVVFGEENDADYYHKYALGEIEIALNSWAGFLRWLNDCGVYSREVIRFFLGALGAVVIPLLAANIVVRDKANHLKNYWHIALIVSLYPTLFYYSLDIYRDVVMCCWFLVVVLCLQKLHESNFFLEKFLVLMGILGFCTLLTSMRPYLGVSLIVSLVSIPLLGARNFNAWVAGGLFVIGLNLLYAAGFLGDIMIYRAKFGAELRGGSNLGIVFGSPFWFVPALLQSLSVQMFGWYFHGFKAVFLFVFESAPVLLGLIYVCRNWRHANELSKFLCVFSIVYGAIWLLANDNMGTAVRLRIFNYISIFLCVALIHVQKKKASRI
ncbi:hypothetical protein [Pseudomonas sp. DWP3-1-2]|uniref:hypothetical protein n=1 Tax=Pseudomonas sp. DWP3-1-2 TaxID=2804645 RepID=UPI003CED1C06